MEVGEGDEGDKGDSKKLEDGEIIVEDITEMSFVLNSQENGRIVEGQGPSLS